MRQDLRDRLSPLLGHCILAFLALSCAGQVQPSGGPLDKTPPEIIATTPAPGTLSFTGNRFSLEFSKYVDRRSVEESIFFSPNVGDLTFDWGSTSVEFTSSDSLRPNTTYVVTVGTDVVDRRNHNRMAKAYTLAFSTGDHLDSGIVSGRAFDPKPEGIMVFAYSLDDRNPDTLNPSHVKPDYLTQIGKDGTFGLPSLKIGRYRVIAVRDEYKDLYYNVQTDEYGVPLADVELTAAHPRVSGLQFQMAREDTTRPFLSSAKALDRTHVLLKFSEEMDTTRASFLQVQIFDSATHSAVLIRDFSFVGPARMDGQVTTGDLDSTMPYQVALEGFRDERGNALAEPAASRWFTGAARKDTLRPEIEPLGLAGGSKNVPRGAPIRFAFSEAVQEGTFERGCALYDSTKAKVAGTWKWWNAALVQFLPSVPLSFGMDYGVMIPLDSVVDFSGNSAHTDSTWVVKFRIVEESQLSSISGVVLDEQKVTKGKIRLTLRPVGMADTVGRTVILASPGSFRVDELFDGRYSLFAFGDDDGNGIYSPGRPYPFKPSEAFVSYGDSLKLRSRWPIEGVTVRFQGYKDQ